MYKIGFVILHYNTYDDTIECINSIEKYVKSTLYDIIVVDNNSLDGSGCKLKNKYDKNSSVYVILNTQNLGFARGNNVGYVFAKYQLKSDFIILLNNDTLLLDSTLYDKIVSEYEKSKYAALGPKVITPYEPYDSNPGPSHLPTINYCKCYIFKMRFLLFLNAFHLDMLYKKLKYFFCGKKRDLFPKDIEHRVENVQLHGCFIVMSPVYVKMFDGLNDKTFLYREEELLYMRLMKSKLKTVYVPFIQIYHKEDRATNTLNSSSHKRMKFFYKNMLMSTSVVLKELENE